MFIDYDEWNNRIVLYMNVQVRGPIIATHLWGYVSSTHHWMIH
jgi:hypothetical protein